MEKKILKNKRSDYARELRKAYRSTMNDISRLDPYSRSMGSTLKISGGGIKSKVEQQTTRGLFDRGPITELHKNGVRDTLINKTLPEAKQLLRESSIKEANKQKVMKESIAKHDAEAAVLRAKKIARQKLVKNLKTAGKVGLGIAGVAGVGYGIKKAIDKKKGEKGEEK